MIRMVVCGHERPVMTKWDLSRTEEIRLVSTRLTRRVGTFISGDNLKHSSDLPTRSSYTHISF